MADRVRAPRRNEDEARELDERVVQINRVAKVIQGGRRFAFSTVVVVGDSNGRVGVGRGKAGEVPESIRKGVDQAKKNMITVPLQGSTIPHEIEVKFGGARVLLRPASPGTGVIAGGPVRPVVELAGIRDILAKSLGSDNPVNVAHATIKALTMLESPRDISRRRGKSMEAAVPPPLREESSKT